MSNGTQPCRDRREAISLLAAGCLPEAEHVELEAHLAGCPGCRAYHAEMAVLAGGLQAWREALPAAQPRLGFRRRWTQAILNEAQSERPARPAWLSWLQQRPALAGLGAVWALILFFQLSAPNVSSPAGSRATVRVSARQMLMALRTGARDLAPEESEAAPPAVESKAERPHTWRRISYGWS